jgi:DNA-binding response OmpR family regulator
MQPNTKARILLAEDDKSLAFIMKDTLEDQGYDVYHCSDGRKAMEVFDRNSFDICLLDVMMPQKNGFEVAQKIRSESELVPILFISTKVLEEDKLKGYQSGADDYITKPFSMPELLLKIEVFLRRTKKLHSDIPREFTFGDFYFNYTSLRLKIGDEENNMTQKEADLLLFFCEHPNTILKREEILLNVWGKDDFFLGRSMDVYITKLRKLLKPSAQVTIETIHTVGYRLNTNS